MLRIYYKPSTCILIFSCITTPVAAQTVATKPPIEIPAECTLSEPARIFTSLKSAPDLASEFKRQGLAMADAGEPFVPFDVTDAASRNLPHRQFVRAYQFKNRTIAWYFHGGFGTHMHVVELRQLRDTHETVPTLRLTGTALLGKPCPATQALLDGVASINDW